MYKWFKCCDVLVKSWKFVFLVVSFIILWVLLFQECVRKVRVDPFVVGVTARAQSPHGNFQMLTGMVSGQMVETCIAMWKIDVMYFRQRGSGSDGKEICSEQCGIDRDKKNVYPEMDVGETS